MYFYFRGTFITAVCSGSLAISVLAKRPALLAPLQNMDKKQETTSRDNSHAEYAHVLEQRIPFFSTEALKKASELPHLCLHSLLTGRAASQFL